MINETTGGPCIEPYYVPEKYGVIQNGTMRDMYIVYDGAMRGMYT